MADLTVNIDMGTRCAECGKAGATDNGICLKCVARAMQGKPMKSRQGQILAQRMLNIRKAARDE